MRIAVDATAAVRQRAGVGRFARGILGGLSRLDAHNEYILLTTGSRRIAMPTDRLPPRSKWRSLPISERLALIVWQRWRLRPAPTAFAGRCALFFTPDFALPPVGRVPSIVTIHDLSFMVHPECADEHLRRYLLSVVPRSVREASAVVTVSQTTSSALQELLGVPGDRIVVVPNGVDVPTHDARPGGGDASVGGVDALLRARFDLEPGYLLAVGTLEPRKNYVRLLQAFARLRAQLRGGDPDRRAVLRLAIVGREGWKYEPVFREVARLGLGPSVRFLTSVDDGDLATLYRGAGGYVFPSLYEGFGIPPLEAMAHGVPVAASTGGAIPEVLGDAAVYFDPLDVDGMAGALRTLLGDESLRSSLIERGHARVRRYSWDASARRLLDLFDAVGAPTGARSSARDAQRRMG